MHKMKEPFSHRLLLVMMLIITTEILSCQIKGPMWCISLLQIGGWWVLENPKQYRLLKLLLGVHQNLMAGSNCRRRYMLCIGLREMNLVLSDLEVSSLLTGFQTTGRY